MTVRELIEKLQNLPPECQDYTICRGDADYDDLPIENVFYLTNRDRMVDYMQNVVVLE